MTEDEILHVERRCDICNGIVLSKMGMSVFRANMRKIRKQKKYRDFFEFTLKTGVIDDNMEFVKGKSTEVLQSIMDEFNALGGIFGIIQLLCKTNYKMSLARGAIRKTVESVIGDSFNRCNDKVSVEIEEIKKRDGKKE